MPERRPKLSKLALRASVERAAHPERVDHLRVTTGIDVIEQMNLFERPLSSQAQWYEKSTRADCMGVIGCCRASMPTPETWGRAVVRRGPIGHARRR